MCCEVARVHGVSSRGATPLLQVSCSWIHDAYPDAKLYGSSRHHRKLPGLPWEPVLLDDPAVLSEFKEDLDLRIPAGTMSWLFQKFILFRLPYIIRTYAQSCALVLNEPGFAGVDFISSNEDIHFSSVVAFHKESKTIHVDDTFMFIPFPDVAKYFFLKQGTVQLHPTLAAALEPRKGAAEDFRKWMDSVFDEWKDVENLCAAHTGSLLSQDNTGESIQARLKWALFLVSPILWLHDLRYGK